MIIKFEDIKPCGNFKKILELLRDKADIAIAKCNQEQKYNSSLSKLIKLICGELGLIQVLEEGHTTGKTWNIEENMLCLLYTHLIICDLNQTAHTYLNNKTDWDSPKKQLQDLIASGKEVYGDLKII